MTYNDDLDWQELSRIAQNTGRGLISALNEGKRQYNEWQSFRAGRSNASIATAVSRTEDEIADIDSAFSAFLAVADYANNQTPTQSDYLYSIRKFS